MSRLAVSFGVALLVVEAAACIAIVEATSDQSDRWAVLAFTTTIGAVFVASGLIALARRPDNRTGVYLAAVGYIGILNGLFASGNEWIFAFSFVVEGLIWVPFSALVLSFPTGELRGRVARTLPVAAGVLLTTSSLAVLLVDSSPHGRHARAARTARSSS